MKDALNILLDTLRGLLLMLLRVVFWILGVSVGLPLTLVAITALMVLLLQTSPLRNDGLLWLESLRLQLSKEQWLMVMYVSAGLITLWLYGWDKYQAARGSWRVPEWNLHFYELIGGWPAGLLAQRLIRHKTLKRSYQAVFWLIGFFHLALVVFLYVETPWWGTAIVGFLGLVAYSHFNNKEVA